ncbi:2-oxoisovalerate dehydrogenase E1 component [Fodinibius sediminis]|uniref:3-methyl-2-oxobutanoate dehydrogenase (2-methylpropanoyl-transferring) n=2 Tax=Fodinibius sediminis TaxID=1214077 RepID=A0A521F7F9_9BACT|nr:2-oxoisovalerate dehydrogenase E1 component [Fodinibius sediminis]
MDALEWKEIVRHILHSRAIDDKEEHELVPGGEVFYQFSARGHELTQTILAHHLTHPHDAVSAYYRCRPLMLALGVSLEDALAASMAKSGSYSDGRDIGVVCNKAGKGATTVLPVAGDVGSQYTPGVGWAEGIRYHIEVLQDRSYSQAICVILGGDGSVATNGFWSALTVASTQELPVLFFIEDNGYGISVPAHYQTPGGNIADNLYSFGNLRIFDGDGTEPESALRLIRESVEHVRTSRGAALLHLSVPRLNGHSYQDNQSYKSEHLLQQERERDPLKKLQAFLVPDLVPEKEWIRIARKAEEAVDQAAEQVFSRAEPDREQVTRYVFAETKADGNPEIQRVGGIAPSPHRFPPGSNRPRPEKGRINMVEGIRRALDYELETNSRVMVLGEDVGAKGGVHAATMGLQAKYGETRVFDTSLSEEGIVGRAVGLAYAGLMPVAEIQFRKYADPATEQLHNCGTVRWRTANTFAAPIVVRLAGGFAKCGDPWHSVCDEVFFARSIGWQLAFPSNAQDAVGLLRSAMRSNNPTIFFEHRNLLDARYARRPYPGDQFTVPFGQARRLREGGELSIITWGAMCRACEVAVEGMDIAVDLLDLRTLMPWDRDAVLQSIRKTNRCLIVHEDTRTAGFGAEISAVIAREAFQYLDAPVERLTMPDIPVPHNTGLMDAVMPDPRKITDKIEALIAF